MMLKKSHANASILKDSRIVFNIKGNSYRLIVKFNFDHGLAFIRFKGSHSEYDKIDDYENKYYQIEAPDPIEAIKIRMEEMHLKQVDLIPEIGGKSRVSEILNRKRRLTVDMIRKLAEKLNLSAGILIGDYQLSK